MSQLDDIKTVQDSLEESFSRRMAELEAQLHSAGSAKDTVSKLAEEFRAFRELMFTMLSMLRKQINYCSATIDDLETRHRRKALIFLGVPEAEKEDCKTAILNVIQKMAISNITAPSITVCHRIGTHKKDHHRPILVRFSNFEHRSAVWRAKTKLRGSSVAVREFLTKTRQAVFAKARMHFGMRACWTQDGVVVVKLPDGSRHKVITILQLDSLMLQYPKDSALATRRDAVASTSSSTTSKARK